MEVYGELTNVKIDLAKEFAKADAVKLQLGLFPPTGEYILMISFNGRKLAVTKFPALGIEKLAGKWNLELELLPAPEKNPQKAGVDSCVIFPYEGGDRNVIAGGSGLLDIQPEVGGEGRKAPLIIYWSHR